MFIHEVALRIVMEKLKVSQCVMANHILYHKETPNILRYYVLSDAFIRVHTFYNDSGRQSSSSYPKGLKIYAELQDKVAKMMLRNTTMKNVVSL